MTAIPRARSTDKRYYGLVEGIVEDNVDPDKQGRVKLRFPWFDEREITEWCRVAQPYAGNDYGMLFVPEIGDEVAVVFGHGDMRFGVVVGGLYNGQDTPPSHRAADLDQKMTKTKGGHVVLLDDTPKKQHVEVTTTSGHQLLLDDTPGSERVRLTTNGGHTVDLDDAGRKISITSSGGNSVTLDDGAGSISIDATAKISLSATAIEIKGGTVTVEGTPIRLN